jgi:DNA N-6-adenine-methyltransferase Dam
VGPGSLTKPLKHITGAVANDGAGHILGVLDLTLGSHQSSVGQSQNHITPRWLLDLLGPFDLDPAAADPRPWPCALTSYTEADDGLSKPWHGRVYLNPSFDRYIVGKWIERLAQHGHGTALLHARCETDWFRLVWQHASAILFLGHRISFCRPDGSEQVHNSGAPPVLVAFGKFDAAHLRRSGIEGALVTTWEYPRARRLPRIQEETAP